LDANTAGNLFDRSYSQSGITALDIFAAVWLVLMPVNSFVLVPAVQGTTPAYLFGFASLLLVFIPGYVGATSEVRSGYLKVLLGLLLLWTFNLCVSQLVNVATPPKYLSTDILINPNSTGISFRSTILTQSLYFAACISIFLFFRYQFQDRWWRYLHWGGWLLAAYGIYEWIYFLIFQTPGDFIANRSYDDTPGSWSQVIGLGPFTLLRIKSTLGEPSFLSIVVLPYLYLALEQRRRYLAAALLFVAVFSTSTSSFLGLLFGAIAMVFFRRGATIRDLFVISCIGSALVICWYNFPDSFSGIFTDKLTGRYGSGEARRLSMSTILQQFTDLHPLQWLSGIGFGYIYSNVGLSLLLNTGLIGCAVFAFAFWRPIVCLPSTPEGLALKVGLIVMFLLFLISVSETFLAPTWMFLGLAWREMAVSRGIERSGKRI
jgi:hypothetical protein